MLQVGYCGQCLAGVLRSTGDWSFLDQGALQHVTVFLDLISAVRFTRTGRALTSLTPPEAARLPVPQCLQRSGLTRPRPEEINMTYFSILAAWSAQARAILNHLMAERL